ncbi:TetR family transcriptional regulator [Smaragdicoccus niigatensis]|uniref:TetR family transcriptional regulator n=1 Tax=Smaragdicoccus niigatensis TaxID=359359 RepID=UPI00035F0F90|nr:TetR family transcriptional regulator [Smaragdicoccus niigatensis]
MIANPFPRIPYAEAARDLLRDSVMTAVDELIRRNGWAATSVAAVAAAAGVSRQTIYKEFGSRRSLADAYIVNRLDDLMDAVDKIMADAPDSETGLRDAFNLFFDMIDEPLIQIVLTGDMGELVELVRETNARATSRLSNVLKALCPTMTDYDAVMFGDSMARIAISHAVVPAVERNDAINRLIHLAMFVINTYQVDEK